MFPLHSLFLPSTLKFPFPSSFFFILHFTFPSSVSLFPSLPFPLSHNKSLSCPLKSEKYQKNIRMPFFLSFHLRYPHSFNNSPSIHLSNLVTSTTGNMSGSTKCHKYLKNVLLNSSTLKF